MKRVVTRAIIEDENQKLVLGKRARGHGEGQWALFGGKPDEGESPEGAILREIEEEIGVVLVNPVFWKEMDDADTDPDKPWKVYFFTGQVSGNLIHNPDEISEVGRFSENDLENLDIAFNHREILHQFLTEKRNNR